MSAATSPSSARPWWETYLGPLVVLLVAGALGWHLYAHYLEVSRHLWYAPLHDRNAHYDFALNMAVNVRNGDLRNLLHDLDGARVWGPLHGIILAGVLLIGGHTHQLAILPSLLGWVGAAVLAFLVARRMAPRCGNLAGGAAALLLLVSPAYRAFATDCMLESAGGFFTLLALYAYLRAVQDHEPHWGRWLGLALSLLFFLKGNYWLLVLIGLGFAELTRQPAFYWEVVYQRILGVVPWRAWLLRQLRQPLNYLLLVLVGMAIAITVTGGGTVEIFGHSVSLKHHHNFVQAAYILFFLRVAWWWWQTGRTWVAQFDPGVQQLIYWHALPLGLWFLLPKRLGYFIWFVSPANSHKQNDGWLSNVGYYWSTMAQDYHLGLWSLLVVTVLVAVTVLAVRWLRPGSSGILWFLGLAALLSSLHPMNKSRYIHSWIEVTWVVAGVGVAVLVGQRWLSRWRLAPVALGTLALGALVLAHGPGLVAYHPAPEGGPDPRRPCSLDVADVFLPHLEGTHRTAFFSSLPLKFFASWAFLERYPNTRRLETEFGHSFSETRPEAFLDGWVRKTRCDAVVFIDVARTSPFFEPPWQDYGCLPEKIEAGGHFALVHHQELPQYRCTVSVWKKVEGNAARR